MSRLSSNRQLPGMRWSALRLGNWESGVGSLRGEPLYLFGLASPDKVFFHIVDAIRDAHGNQRSALADFDAPELPGKAQCASPHQRGAFQEAAGRHPRSNAARLPKF